MDSFQTVTCCECGKTAKLTGKQTEDNSRVTTYIYECRNHHFTYVVHYYTQPSMRCPRCGKEKVTELDHEAIKAWGMCLRCDHIMGDLLIEAQIEAHERREDYV